MGGALVAIGAGSALACVFAVAVAGKLTPAGLDALSTAAGELWPGRARLPGGVRRALAGAVVVVESTVVVLGAVGIVGILASPRAAGVVSAALALALVLLIVFTAAQATALARGRRPGCACFGRAAERVGPVSVVRNVTMTVLAAAGLLASASPWPEVAPGAWVVGVTVGIAAALLLVAFADVAELLASPPPGGLGTRSH